jgi:hypothetical protein
MPPLVHHKRSLSERATRGQRRTGDTACVKAWHALGCEAYRQWTDCCSATRRLIGLPLQPRLTSRNLRKRRERRQVQVADTPGQHGTAGARRGFPPAWAVPHPLGVEQVAVGCEDASCGGTGERRARGACPRGWVANMPACEAEGGDGVGAKRLAVIAGTW